MNTSRGRENARDREIESFLSLESLESFLSLERKIENARDGEIESFLSLESLKSFLTRERENARDGEKRTREKEK